MRADRLLSALLLLQAHGKQTGKELASRLAVSERTVHRDMEALSTAGVPVFALRGVRGGWQLDEQWRTHVPGLEEAELRAFLMAQPRVVGDKHLAAAAERALDKLFAALPVRMRQRAVAMRQRLYVDTTGWYGRAENLAQLPVVQDAVARDRKLRLTYGKRHQPASERVVAPFGLVAKGATWYLVAGTDHGVRTFRVSRIERAQILDVPCVRPPDFDLAAYWESSTAQFLESRRRFATTLRLAPAAASRVQEWFRHAIDPSPATPPEAWVTLNVHFDDEDQAAFIVLGFGTQVEVVAPPTLRARVQRESAAAALQHGAAVQ